MRLLLHARKQTHHVYVTILVLHEIIYSASHLWFIPPPNTAPTDTLSTKTRGNSEINGDQLRRRYENVSFVGTNERIHTSQGEIEGCALSYGHFTDTLISCFSLSCPISVFMPYLLGRIREAGAAAGKRCMCECVLVHSRCKGVWCACDEWDS